MTSLTERNDLKVTASAPGSPSAKAAASALVNEFCARLAWRDGGLVLLLPELDPDLGLPTPESESRLSHVLSVLGLSEMKRIRLARCG